MRCAKTHDWEPSTCVWLYFIPPWAGWTLPWKSSSRAARADPLCPVLPSTETFVRLCRREFDAAVLCGKSAIDLHPYQHMGRAHYAQALEATGQIEQALAQHRLVCVMSPDLPWYLALEGGCLARNGQAEQAIEILNQLQRLRETEYLDAYYISMLLESLGRRDAALEELERAYRESSATLFMLNVDWRMDALRKDTRCKQLQRELFDAGSPPATRLSAESCRPL